MTAKVVTETKRLLLRELTEKDYPGLCIFFQDESLFQTYGKLPSRFEVSLWLEKQLKNYKENGYGIWAVVLKDSDKMIGLAGLAVRQYGDGNIHELGYMFSPLFRGEGYATEAAYACRNVAFNELKLEKLCSVVRIDNQASRAVARKNGMRISEMIYIKLKEAVFPHYMYCVANQAFSERRLEAAAVN